MGKRARRRQREAAPAAATADSRLAASQPTTVIEPPAPELHITVAAVGMDQSPALDVRHETALVKAALLYADRVTLASPQTMLLASSASLGIGDRRRRLDSLTELLAVVEGESDHVRIYREYRARRRRLSPQQRLALNRLEYQLERSSDELVDAVDEMLEEAHAGELGLAIDAGLVDIHPLGTNDPEHRGELDTTIEHFADLVAQSVSANARTFPLFDDGAGGILRQMLAEGKVADARSRRPTEAGIAGELLASLEAFPGAEMDVVLDVREQMRTPLIRFRAALAKVSTEFAHEAWDESFTREVQDLYRREVAPALEHVRMTLDELGARQTLLRAASSGEGVGTMAALCLTVAGALGFTELPGVVYGTSPPAAVAAAAREARERRRFRQDAQRSDFYFLYEVSRALSG